MFETVVTNGHHKWIYKGIARYNVKNLQKGKALVAIVMSPGGLVEVWYIESKDSISELRRYYEECSFTNPVVLSINIAEIK